MIETDRHKRKFKDFVFPSVENISSPKILEFGVSERGMSTQFFLDLCEKNNGNLVSVDSNKNAKKFNSKKWKFINSRDDNFKEIYKIISKDLFDIIYLDTTHKANHVLKILYYYYDFLKLGGCFFVDDTAWFTYTEKREKNNFSLEVNNYETFEKLTDVHNNNHENFDLEFSFVGTGVAKIRKLSNNKLNPYKKTYTRTNSFIKLIRKIFFNIKNKT